MRGKRTLIGKDLVEVIDLYRWGARVLDICVLYNVHKKTLQANLKRNRIPLRVPYRAPKSSRPQIPAGVRLCDDGPAPDLLLRSSARAQLDRRIAKHLSDASKHSCPEAASVYRSSSSRSGNPRRARE